MLHPILIQTIQLKMTLIYANHDSFFDKFKSIVVRYRAKISRNQSVTVQMQDMWICLSLGKREVVA